MAFKKGIMRLLLTPNSYNVFRYIVNHPILGEFVTSVAVSFHVWVI